LQIESDRERASRKDRELCDAARSGDSSALETLLLAHYDRVHALCVRMLANRADAEDATQQSILLAVRSLSRFDGRSSFGTWMYRIATNTCIDELRRRRRRPTDALAGDESLETLEGRGRGRAHHSDPAEVASERVDVDAALGSLPVEFRAAVVLRDLCDLTYEEIAANLEIPVGTVRSRIARGRAALAALLQQSGNQKPSPSVETSMGRQDLVT